MLDATRRLKTLFERQAVDWHDSLEIRVAAKIIVQHGSTEDAEALLPIFIGSPSTCSELLLPLMAHGDARTAKVLFENCITDGDLNPAVPTEVLHVLGYLGLEEVESILWKYATKGDHSTHRDACLGLLNLPCKSLKSEIADAIRACQGRDLFQEFLPALACKTGDPTLLANLIEMGDTTASTDCNGGVILGIALFGDVGRQAFSEILWKPEWQAFGPGTGSDYWLCVGMRAQAIRIADLYLRFKNDDRSQYTADERQSCALCLESLIAHHLAVTFIGLRCVTDPGDDFSHLRKSVFEWSTPHRDDSLTSLWRDIHHEDHLRQNRIYDLVRRLEQAISHRWELHEFRSPTTSSLAAR